MRFNKDEEIDDLIGHLQESDIGRGIRMEALPESVEYGFFTDDVYDADGYSIVARPYPRFEKEGEGFVQATFPHGADPHWVANALRKFASVLEGPKGFAVSTMEKAPGCMDHAIRLEDGGVVLFSIKNDVRRDDEEDELPDDLDE